MTSSIFGNLVDLNDQIHMVDLEHYQNTVCDETWRVINEIATEVKGRNLRLSFFNSTPQGGGGKENESMFFAGWHMLMGELA